MQKRNVGNPGVQGLRILAPDAVRRGFRVVGAPQAEGPARRGRGGGMVADLPGEDAWSRSRLARSELGLGMGELR